MGAPGEPSFDPLAIASVVTGVLGLISCCCCFLLPLPIAAIVTGALGLSKINEHPETSKGKELCYIGIGLGVLSLLITVAMFIINMINGGSMTQPSWQQFK